MDGWFLSNVFSASFWYHMFFTFLSMVTFFQILSPTWNIRINPTWLWSIIPFKYDWVWVVKLGEEWSFAWGVVFCSSFPIIFLLCFGNRNVGFIEWVENYSFLFNFVEEFVLNWYYLFFKSWIEFNKEAWSF